MLAAAGISFLIVSAALFGLRLRRGVYSRYPFEQFFLVGAAFVLGLVAAIANPGPVTLALLAVEAVALALVVRYLGIGARFQSEEAGVKAGERFPDFVLPDSEGAAFHSRSLLGTSAALYLFYRGHF
jgi:cytochrome oxidase Cu insertion factor (SCO1/SenC/PrrC family)